jgi:hypothetical protein
VTVTREDGAWLADVDLDGAFTESDDLPGLDTYCREVTVLMDDLPESAMPDCEFAWELHLSDDDLVDAIAQQRGVPRTDVLARGWSLADVAALLNAPAERVTQVTPPAVPARIAR